jgi:hypothetical protein
MEMKLLDFYEAPEETSASVCENISKRLIVHNLSLKSVIAFSVDNVHVNFGKKMSVYNLFNSYYNNMAKTKFPAHTVRNG